LGKIFTPVVKKPKLLEQVRITLRTKHYSYKTKQAYTKNRVPRELFYWEGCLNQKYATHREKYLKAA
jgi:predicted GIY-YIG superfamily endonuclease